MRLNWAKCIDPTPCLAGATNFLRHNAPICGKANPGRARRTRNRETFSSIDLFGFNWTLIAEDERWATAVSKAKQAVGATMDFVQVGHDVTPPRLDAFVEAFGIRPSGASLVRPDGYIARRAEDASPQPAVELVEVLKRVSLSMKWAENPSIMD